MTLDQAVKIGAGTTVYGAYLLTKQDHADSPRVVRGTLATRSNGGFFKMRDGTLLPIEAAFLDERDAWDWLAVRLIFEARRLEGLAADCARKASLPDA